MAQKGKRRALGQHFLRDTRIAQQIADTAMDLAEKYESARLLEVGPGRGAITDLLLERLGRSNCVHEMVIAEKDRELAQYWEERMKSWPSGSPSQGPKKVVVQEGDFVVLAEDRWLSPSLSVASNLPYSAGTAIVVRLARHPDKVASMVLMFQQEVAERLRAEIGSKSWGSLSVWIQNRWDVRKLVSVPPGAFRPPPEVNSEVVVLEPRSEPRVLVPHDSENLWEQLLKVCFAHRRKMLRSGLPSGMWRNALERSQVDGSKRAEALDWPEWSLLFEALLAETKDQERDQHKR